MMRLRQIATVTMLSLLAGCATGPIGSRIWDRHTKTNYRTPAMRADAIRELAAKADGTSSPQQQELTLELARQIQIEPDPLVREAIVDSLTGFRTPLASQVLQAGLADSDPGVQRKCCAGLATVGGEQAIPVLAKVVQESTDVDLRITAVRALGDTKSKAATEALAVALADRDPAMQYAGMQAMRQVSDRDYGGNVEAWLAYARGENPAEPTSGGSTAVAQRMKELSPF